MAVDVKPINNFETNTRPARSTSRRASSRRTPSLAPVSRYDGDRERTWHPAEGLGSVPASANADTTVAAVADPYGDGLERILATVNRRVDVLEYERSRGLISDAAYHTGRLVQGVFEHRQRVGGSNWAGASRRNPAEVRDAHAQRLIDDGKVADAHFARMRDRLGMIDARLLQRIIGEGKTYEDCAALIGRSGDRGQRYVAARFRDALEDLAEAWAGKGKALPPADDKHAAAAPGVPLREDLSLIGGATLSGVEGEIATLQAEGNDKEAAKLVPVAANLRLRRAIARARQAR